MSVSYKLKLTLLDTKFQKLTAGKLTDGISPKSDKDLISHSLVFVAYLTIYGDEASQR